MLDVYNMVWGYEYSSVNKCIFIILILSCFKFVSLLNSNHDKNRRRLPAEINGIPVDAIQGWWDSNKRLIGCGGGISWLICRRLRPVFKSTLNYIHIVNISKRLKNTHFLRNRPINCSTSNTQSNSSELLLHNTLWKLQQLVLSLF